jgi:hypothetical protein
MRKRTPRCAFDGDMMVGFESRASLERHRAAIDPVRCTLAAPGC